MTYLAKPKLHHPELPKNALGLTRRDYEGTVSTLCAGCGHDSISAAIIQACWELAIQPHRVAKLTDCQVRHVAVPVRRPTPAPSQPPAERKPMLERVALLMRSGSRSQVHAMMRDRPLAARSRRTNSAPANPSIMSSQTTTSGMSRVALSTA